MRIVHTSDWHAGRIWKSLNRLNEIAAALDHLAQFIEREKVDLLLHSGDVFDHSLPMADAEKVVFDFLKRVGRSGTKTILIAGNHDFPPRMEAWATLTELVDVHTVARPVAPERGGVLSVPTRSGERAIAAALPFTSVGMLLSAMDIAATDGSGYASYADAIRNMIHILSAQFRSESVNLLIAHTHIEEAILAGSERKATVGKEWAATPQALPPAAHYVALGHVHKPQRVEAAPAPTYYGGSILQMDFAEAGEQKSFVYVEARPGKPAKIRRIAYEGTVPLTRVSLDFAELQKLAEGLRHEGYLEVTVKLEKHDSDINSKVRKMVPNAVSVRQEYPEQQEEVRLHRRGLAPAELYSLYHRGQYSAEPSERILRAFQELYHLVESGPQ